MKVSIIVPVFRAERYLAECLQSLLDQTLRDLEIIVILDAPTDGSPAIADRFAASNPGIKVLRHATNRGVSAARNTGIEAATGTWLGFVDSDDFVGPHMYQEMVAAGERADADLVTCGHTRRFEDGGFEANHPSPFAGEGVVEHDRMMALLAQAHQRNAYWFVFRNIFRRDMVNAHQMRFDERQSIGEDSFFNLQAFFFARRVVVLEEFHYHYRANPTSLTNTRGRKQLTNDLEVQFEAKRDFYRSHHFPKAALRDLYNGVLGHQLPMMLDNALLAPTKTSGRTSDGSSACRWFRSRSERASSRLPLGDADANWSSVWLG